MIENTELSDTPDDKTTKYREELFDSLMNDFGKACENHKVEVAIAIAVHPDIKEPIVFLRGETFDAGRLLAYVLKRIKQNILDELDTDI